MAQTIAAPYSTETVFLGHSRLSILDLTPAGNMKISLPRISVDDKIAKLTATVTYGMEQNELWYSIPAEHANWFSTDRCDGFVVGLLFQAMERNEDLVVEGGVSSRLFHSLQNFYIPLMAQAFPDLHRINIKPRALLDSVPAKGRGVCTGFSGGIDSFATFKQHFVDEASDGHKITHLLFHNVGSHGHEDPARARKLFGERHQMVLPFAREVGVPLIMVDSNLSEVFKADFIKRHSALNASVPLLLQNQFQRYYYASTYKYADCTTKGIDDIAHFDPFAFHLFSTEGIDCVSTGCQMSRVEKTSSAATYEPSHRYLNVCVDPDFEGRNCSVCFKCSRTILTLELLGKAHLYKTIFDLEKFNKVRHSYVQKVLAYKHGSFEAEIAALYRERGSGFLAGAFRIRHLLDKLLLQG